MVALLATMQRRAHRGGAGPAALGALACWLALGCEAPSPPRRECTVHVWAQPQVPGASLAILGSFNEWFAPGIALQPSAEHPGWHVAELDLPPGEYGYLVLEAGVHRLDPHNPLTTFWREQGDLEVSLLRVDDCEAPRLVIDAVQATPAGALVAEGRFEAASDGSPLARAEARTLAGAAVPTTIEPDTGALRLELAGLPRGKHTLEITATDAAGRAAHARVGGWVQPVAETWGDGLMYQVMIDRYRGEGGEALAPPASAGGRAGGTLDGVRAELERGTFEALGVSALWLSPVYVNPVEPREGRGDGRMYEGYHGYWVLDSRGVDARIGGEAALDALIAAAHERGVRVIFDLVPNHVYEDNPRYPGGDPALWNQHDPPCVCGLGSCDWGRYIQTCWFTDYLPDVRLQEPAAVRLAAEDAVWWMHRFDADGVRVDAVPMMPRAATRRIADALRTSAAPDDLHFLVGEVFTGPGAWGVDAIRYYLGPESLDSVFDFPLMWALRDALAHESAGFAAVEEILADVEAKTVGADAVIARMLGNHDTTRFASEAAGDAAGDPWDSPPPQPEDPDVYARQRLALGLLLTLPGLPVLYYGDEVGLAGRNDPDCRRVMPADAALSQPQRELQATARALGRLRRCSEALRRGARTPLVVDGDAYAFARTTDAQAALVLVSRPALGRAIALPELPFETGDFTDALTGDTFAVAPGAALPMPPRGLRVLLPAGDPCLPLRP